MELILGQNIILGLQQSLQVDIDWSSSARDLPAEVYGLVVDEQQVCSSSDFLWQDNPTYGQWLKRSPEGKRFSVALPVLKSELPRFQLLLGASTTVDQTLEHISNINILVSDLASGQQIARMNIPSAASNGKAAYCITLCEFYRYKGNWKLKFLARPWKVNLSMVASHYHFSLPAQLYPVKSDPSPRLTAGAELKPGQTISFTAHFEHCKTALWQVRCVPPINDVALHIAAIGYNGKVRNIKDFLYTENTELRQGGVVLAAGEASIQFEHVPSDIKRLQLLAVRTNPVKRFSSADYMETRIISAVTGQTMCNFTLGTSQKNYNCIILLELYRHKEEWRAKAIGQGYAEGIQQLAANLGFSPPRQRGANRPRDRTHQPPPAPPNNRIASPGSAPGPTTTATPLRFPAKNMVLTSYGIAGLGCFTLAAGFSSIPALISGCGMLVGGVLMGIKYQRIVRHQMQEANERLVLNLIKQHNYQITAFDIAADTEFSVEQATEILDNLSAKGAGTIDYSDEGSLFYNFDAMKSAASISASADNWH